MTDDWQGIGAIAAMVVMGVASDGLYAPGDYVPAAPRPACLQRGAQPPLARHSGIAAGTEMGAASDPGRKAEPDAGALAARDSRAHHNGEPRGGAGAVVIEFPKKGRAEARPSWVALRESTVRTIEHSGGVPHATCSLEAPARIRR